MSQSLKLFRIQNKHHSCSESMVAAHCCHCFAVDFCSKLCIFGRHVQRWAFGSLFFRWYWFWELMASFCFLFRSSCVFGAGSGVAVHSIPQASTRQCIHRGAVALRRGADVLEQVEGSTRRRVGRPLVCARSRVGGRQGGADRCWV